MFQNKKLKRNATYAIAEVAEVALCASNCALPTSAYYHMKYFLPYLKPFFTETAFYAKLAGRFAGPKTKVT